MTNQSFTEYKSKKKNLEFEIIKLLNAFSKEFGLKIDSIYIKDHIYTFGAPCQEILSLKIETDL